MDSRPIGVFDSGLGGLTCIPFLRKCLPDERIIYFGDTARTPYGSKAVSTIRSFSEEIVHFLLEQNVKLVMIACNTVSSTCLTALEERFPELPFVGTIKPMVAELARELPGDARLGVIGTKATTASGLYPRLLREARPELVISQQACPLFVPLIEEGLLHTEMMRLAVHHYLDSFTAAEQLTHLLLGCTHYPLIEDEIRRAEPELEILNPAASMAREVEAVLRARDALAPHRAEKGKDRFYASDLSENFVRMINEILGGEEAGIFSRSLSPEA